MAWLGAVGVDVVGVGVVATKKYGIKIDAPRIYQAANTSHPIRCQWPTWVLVLGAFGDIPTLVVLADLADLADLAALVWHHVSWNRDIAVRPCHLMI